MGEKELEMPAPDIMGFVGKTGFGPIIPFITGMRGNIALSPETETKMI